MGEDLVEMRVGVLGLKGFIPLEDGVILCRDECCSAYFNGAPPKTERIP